MNVLTLILQKLGVLNRIEGAQFYTNRRSYINQGYQSARFDASKADRMELVRKSRYFEYNNHIANRLADIFECYTVGAGIPITPTSSDAGWNERAKKVFETWCKYPCQNSRMSFAQFQSLVARRWFFDGETFVLLTKGESNRPRVQLVETHLVNTPPSLTKEEGETVIDGVWVDRSLGNRPLGYYIGREDAKGQLTYGAPTKSDYVVHICEPSRANEYRTLPFCTPVINLLHDLDDLHIYEMQAAKDAASTSLFIKTATGDFDPKAFRAEKLTKTTVDKDGVKTNGSKVEYYEDITDSKAKVLKTGDEVTQFNSNRPSVVTQQYWRMVTEQVCNGFGIPYVLAFPESLQGTTYRGTLAMASAMFKSRFSVMAEAWTRVYEWVMKYEVATNPELKGAPEDWFSHSMQSPRSPDVDVGYNSSAALAELEAGVTNYDLLYSPRGLDWRKAMRDLKEQQDFARSIGLVLPSLSQGGNNGQVAAS